MHANFTSSILAPELVVLHLCYVRFFHFSCYSTCNSEIGTCACILVSKDLPQTVYVECGCTTFSWFHCFTSFHNEDYLLTWITTRGNLAQLVVSSHIWIGIILGEKFDLYFIVNTYLDESVAFGILHCRYCKHISWTYAFLVSS